MQQPTEQTFGSLLKDYLRVLEDKDCKITQEDLAEICDCSPGTIKNYLGDKNKGHLKPERVDAIARALDKDLGWSAAERARFVALGKYHRRINPNKRTRVLTSNQQHLPDDTVSTEPVAVVTDNMLPAIVSLPPWRQNRMVVGSGVALALLLVGVIVSILIRGVFAGESTAPSLPPLPPLPKPSWSGYTVTRGVATCQRPHCEGYTASIIVDFQWSTAVRQVWLAGHLLECPILPATLTVQLFSCNNYRIDTAHEYIGMTYAVNVPNPRTHHSTRTLGWLRLDFFADGHTTQMSGMGTTLEGPKGV